MTPETPPVTVTSPELGEASQALEDAATTLDDLGEALEETSIEQRAKADEILAEVRKWQSTVDQLSQSMTQQNESPSIQTILMQLTALQTSVDKIQAEVEALRSSNQSAPPETVTPSGDQEGQERTGETTGDSSASRNPRGSNQSATPPPEPPKKKRYVKI